MQPLPPPKNRSAPSGIGARDSTTARADNQASPRVPSQPPTSGPSVAQSNTTAAGPRKRKHRGGKKRKNRRQSFAAPLSEISAVQSNAETMNPDPLVEEPSTSPPPFYRVRNADLSDDSLDSSALLDHRAHPPMRARRDSRLTPTQYGSSQRSGFYNASSLARAGSHRRRHKSNDVKPSGDQPSGDHDDIDDEATDKTPLIATALQHRSPERRNYGLFKSRSRASSQSSSKRKLNVSGQSYPTYDQDYDVNNPPSMPGSPTPEQFDSLGPGEHLSRPSSNRRDLVRDALIDIDIEDEFDDDPDDSRRDSPQYRPGGLQRHQTIHLPVEGDVCYPGEAESEMAFGEYEDQRPRAHSPRRRRRRRAWPQLWVLDEWSQQEKEQRDEVPGAKKIKEQVLIEGRLRPRKHIWQRMDEDGPYRYTYFNEDFESTIHSQTISELVQPGGSFQELFIPEPPLLDDSSDSSEEEDTLTGDKHNDVKAVREAPSVAGRLDSLFAEGPRSSSRAPSMRVAAAASSASGEHTPSKSKLDLPTSTEERAKPKKYGPRPTFWLDIQSPTEQEMRVLCKAFGIHALTSEDIMMQEAREKVELFRHYYFINYRTFEQDHNSEDYLEPINMYVIVFRSGILTFHFSQIPHPANVRRRIRQLSDYLILSSDWISYAIIDDITDVYLPLIHNIEQEVDDIDELILRAFSTTNELAEDDKSTYDNDKQSDAGENKGPSGIDMLRRVGECRKKVMALYRLLGNKADVIKGFAKRCNEQWEVAPKSEIGLYLGDIQDHILTMTSNLSHYETLLSRAHSNYLAQVSIRMNERAEQTSDVLGKLTVIGTIVLPMNIITGMWGMNVKVPGQGVENLNWFAAITAGLFAFGFICYFVCKKMYKIV